MDGNGWGRPSPVWLCLIGHWRKIANMRVGIVQPSYIPWRGYFDLIDQVDLFVFLDDAQYTKRSWRTRNRVKSSHGVRWLSVPVHAEYGITPICEVRIDNAQKWVEQHIGIVRQAYMHAPFFNDYAPFYFSVLQSRIPLLSEMNISLTHWLMKCLKIKTPTLRSSSLGIRATRTDRLLRIIQAVGGDCYLSGPSAKAYLDETQFKDSGIRLEYKTYDYAPYPQQWGGFVGDVSILDLLFNTGPEARKFLSSHSPNEVAVS